jgi:hypothetical protein
MELGLTLGLALGMELGYKLGTELGERLDKELGSDTGTELGAPFRSSPTTELGEALVLHQVTVVPVNVIGRMLR